MLDSVILLARLNCDRRFRLDFSAGEIFEAHSTNVGLMFLNGLIRYSQQHKINDARNTTSSTLSRSNHEYRRHSPARHHLPPIFINNDILLSHPPPNYPSPHHPPKLNHHRTLPRRLMRGRLYQLRGIHLGPSCRGAGRVQSGREGQVSQRTGYRIDRRRLDGDRGSISEFADGRQFDWGGGVDCPL